MCPGPTEEPSSPASRDLLDSWKEIAKYLNRDIRTVQRWERDRGLPVCRFPGGEKAAVYAVRSELDAWRQRGLSASQPGTVVDGVTQPASRNHGARPKSIAVLPFEDMSSERDQEYLCDGLADEVTNSLAQVPGIRVVARTSAFAFKRKAMDVREIGRQLNARALLEGGLQRSGRKLRITLQLIDTQDGYHLWSQRFDGTLDGVFDLEDIIARAAAEQMRDPSSAGAYAARPRTTNPEAYRLCLQGRHFYCQVTRDAYLAAIECYRRAIQCDPLCARAWAGLADCYWDGAEVGYLTGAEDLVNGRHAALRAVELDPYLADAHATLGVLRGVCDYDWASAEQEFKEGLRLQPASPVVHARYAMFFLQAHHRLQEAVTHVRSALDVDPLSPLLHSCLSHLFVLGRQYDQAIEEAQHALALDPGYTAALAMLGMTYAFQGKYQELIGLASKMPPPSEDNPVLLGGAGWALAAVGQTDRARMILAGLKVPGRYGRMPSWSIAWIHQGLGETDEALTWLERAVQEHDPKVVFIPTKPFWDSLRPHPRFHSILQHMGLPVRDIATSGVLA